MSKLQTIARAIAAGAIALLATTTLSAAQNVEQQHRPMHRLHVFAKKHVATKPATVDAAAQAKSSALALATEAPPEQKEHRLILQVNSNDPAAMNLALNNAVNAAQYYKEVGEKVKIEVVTFGPGLHMLRDDTSPVKARIETLALSTPEISYKACGNTRENMSKTEKKEISIVPQADVVKSGVIHIMQLEEDGWTYVKP
jgi:uncharacterized protein